MAPMILAFSLFSPCEYPVAYDRQFLGSGPLAIRRHRHVFDCRVNRTLFRLTDDQNRGTAALHDGGHGTEVHITFGFSTPGSMAVQAIGAKDG